MSFSKFPHFQKFSPDDIDSYLNFYSTLKYPYCDFSIDDVCIWLNYNGDLEMSELNDNLVLRFSNVIDKNTQYYTFLGTSKLYDTLTTLMSYFHDNLIEPCLYYIPEETATLITELKNRSFTIEEDVDNRDYIYNVDDLLGLQGKPYENIRRRINHFKRENPNIEIREFNLQDENDKNLIRNTITKWSRRKSSLRNDPDNQELNVIRKHLRLADELPVHAYGLFVNNALVNINIFNLPPHKDWLIFNHIKCDYTYKNVYGYAFYALCQIAHSRGIKWVNFEQDLGIEGLRQIKTFFRPAKFLKRYTISLDHRREPNNPTGKLA